MERQKTNSITHLVKIVASEVFDDRMCTLDEYVTSLVDQRVSAHLTENLITAMENDLCMQSMKWTYDEDEQLRKELYRVAETLAKLHKRTAGAILARIKKITGNT